MNITVFSPAGVGDTIFACPMLQILRHREPQATIHYIGHLEAGQLLEGAGLVDYAHSQSSRHSPENVYSGAIEVAGRMGMDFDDQRKKAMLQSLGNPDLVIAFSMDAMAMSYAFEAVGVPQFTVQHWQPPMGMHQSEFKTLALRNLGWLDKHRVNVVDWNCEVLHIPYLKKERTVVLHPSSGQSYKNWPIDNYIQLCRKMNDMGIDTIVLEGPGTSSYRSQFLGSRILNLSLKECAGLFSLKLPFIGNDSGLTHMAAISGCPTIGLYGSTHPNEWGIIGPDVHIIRTCDKEPNGSVQVCEDKLCMTKIPVNLVLSYYLERIQFAKNTGRVGTSG